MKLGTLPEVPIAGRPFGMKQGPAPVRPFGRRHGLGANRNEFGVHEPAIHDNC